MIGIVVSHADRASTHIGEHLLENADWDRVRNEVYERPGFQLREFEANHLDLDRVAESFDDPAFVVVASKHSGDTGPLLSAHFTGNFGEAAYGGEPETLSVPAPNALRHVIRSLDEYAPEDYDVAMECTHHGPTDLGAPGLFAELGSGPDQWADPEGANAVAKAVLDLRDVRPFADRTLVGFGGNHYAPRPTRLIRETDVAVGHVAADWSIEALGDPGENRGLIRAMFESSEATCAIVDGAHPAVEETIADLGYRVKSETWVRETSGVDPDVVEALEGRLGPVESGLRFGGRDPGEDPYIVVDLPQELLAECHGIDPAETVTAVGSRAIAYQTEENGNRVGAAAAVQVPRDYDEMVEALAAILEREYDEVRFAEEEEVVAERSAFDPERAEELGVPEGPKFGTLAAGEPVTVGGETINPERVHVREIRRFEVRRPSDAEGKGN